MKNQRLKEYIKKVIKQVMEEANVTGGSVPAGGTAASFSAGYGENYATPFAFDKKKSADGAAKKTYSMLGYKKVGKIPHKTYDIEKWK